ncbi:MAG: 4a-hydroxytetrahydrobiopterin dehydratase [Candidatus Ancaeobacter aquaticus]|nr:4a-hydroxytetrahydrobiopterin dehydratase [Candidatus Ancaeobacter aquaticus]
MNDNELCNKNCTACRLGTPPLAEDDINEYMSKISSDWKLVDTSHIVRVFTLKNFTEAMTFVNKIAECAESEGHHPDITISWNKVTLILTTHASKGLTENDFIMAYKIDDIAK